VKIVHVLPGEANPGTMDGVSKVVHHLANVHHCVGRNVEVWGLSSAPQNAATQVKSTGLVRIRPLWRYGRSFRQQSRLACPLDAAND
jgi:hypothetical protein